MRTARIPCKIAPSFLTSPSFTMRVSQFFISTLKEAPSEAELPSHKLMLRAGYIRKLASGLYTWMPPCGNCHACCRTRKPGGEVDEVKRGKNRNKSKIRARVEHVFAVLCSSCHNFMTT